MNYAVVLASGKGTRIKDSLGIPKQFRNINGKPVIVYTINNILKVNRFHYVYIVVSDVYIDYMKELIDKYFKRDKDKLLIVKGGKERIDSVENAINAICNDRKVEDDDVVVIHDAVRRFVTEKILNDSIDCAREKGAVVAAVPVTDTLLISETGKSVDEIPKRSLYYKGQAPDSFRLKLFVELLKKISVNDRKIITGTSQICTLNNVPIYMIEGDEINFKITTDNDLKKYKDMVDLLT